MNKQEVLEKIILYITKRPSEEFYTVKKDKYYININSIDNSLRRQSFSTTTNGDYENFIKQICEDYSMKRITFKDFKNELETLFLNISVERDRQTSNIKCLAEKRKFVESEIDKLLQILIKYFEICGTSLSEIDLDLSLTDYEIFVLKPLRKSLQKVKIKKDYSYLDSLCKESTLKFMVDTYYEDIKNKTLDKYENKPDLKSDRKEKYYEDLKRYFLGLTKEEIFISLEHWWSNKLKLQVLYYVPGSKNEQKTLSFFYIIDQLRVNYVMKIDPYLHQTIQTISPNYTDFAIEEFREYYKDVFGHNRFEKNFLEKVKTLLSWHSYRILFINICIVSNVYLFGELLREWTKNNVMFPSKNYKLDKKYQSFIDSDITNQKIISGLETKKHIDDLLHCIYTFDNREEITDTFIEKNDGVIKAVFD
jgi:hypothetical protein